MPRTSRRRSRSSKRFAKRVVGIVQSLAEKKQIRAAFTLTTLLAVAPAGDTEADRSFELIKDASSLDPAIPQMPYGAFYPSAADQIDATTQIMINNIDTRVGNQIQSKGIFCELEMSFIYTPILVAADNVTTPLTFRLLGFEPFVDAIESAGFVTSTPHLWSALNFAQPWHCIKGRLDTVNQKTKYFLDRTLTLEAPTTAVIAGAHVNTIASIPRRYIRRWKWVVPTPKKLLWGRGTASNVLTGVNVTEPGNYIHRYAYFLNHSAQWTVSYMTLNAFHYFTDL